MDEPVRNTTWLILSALLAAGLALVSLYVLGLLFLPIAALALSGAPASRQMRQAVPLAMLVGFEFSLGLLAYLYRFVWFRQDGGWYVYLAVLAGLGLLILVGVSLLRSREAAASSRNP